MASAQKKPVVAAYTENDSVKECWKNSMFKKLFSDRSKLFDKYPNVTKGLALADPKIKFGNGAYTFKTSDVCDSVSFKDGSTEFQARYKKDTKKFDVSLKDEISKGYTGLVKYENRGDNLPHYVVGLDFNQSGVLGNLKFNPVTGLFKCSALYDANSVLEGAKIATDLKTSLDFKSPSFNVGATYKSPAGTTGLAYNDKGFITVNHFVEVDKKLSAGIEFVQPTQNNTPKNPLALAAAYKINKEHEIRARVNKSGELSVAVKKDFARNFSIQLATVMDMQKPESMFKAPVFGFKLQCDM